VNDPRIAFIGGSGLYQMEGLTDVDRIDVETPFGNPSDRIVLGTVEGARVAFLPRHGVGHRFSPTLVPNRANVYALKSLGVERIVSISAVGSLQESVRPLDMVVPDQLIDRTRSRVSTFFDDGIVAHVGFADPYCPVLSDVLTETASTTSTVHSGGAYVVIEGPQFSTRAESEIYRSWGASVIGMTALPEAKLAREAEMCYATLALVTDYDTWHDAEADVSVEVVVASLKKNVAHAQQVLRALVSKVLPQRACDCASALKNAIITDEEHISAAARDRMSLIVGRYVRVPERSHP